MRLTLCQLPVYRLRSLQTTAGDMILTVTSSMQEPSSRLTADNVTLLCSEEDPSAMQSIVQQAQSTPQDTAAAHQHHPQLLVIMVGLPVRGKLYLATKIQRYMTWCGTKIVLIQSNTHVSAVMYMAVNIATLLPALSCQVAAAHAHICRHGHTAKFFSAGTTRRQHKRQRGDESQHNASYFHPDNQVPIHAHVFECTASCAVTEFSTCLHHTCTRIMLVCCEWYTCSKVSARAVLQCTVMCVLHHDRVRRTVLHLDCRLVNTGVRWHLMRRWARRCSGWLRV